MMRKDDDDDVANSSRPFSFSEEYSELASSLYTPCHYCIR